MSLTVRWFLRMEIEVKENVSGKRGAAEVDKEGKWRCNGGQGGASIMMGFKERAFAPLVAVSLEELVPQDHFYRHLQKTLDLSFVYDLVREYYAAAGRPSIDPVVFFKLHLVMFFEDIRSERLLMRKARGSAECPVVRGVRFG